MKTKLIALTLVITLLFTGCAYLQFAKTLLCHPTDQQINTAQNAVSFLDWGSRLINQPQIGAAITTAILVFNRIRPGLCVALDELEKALDTVDEVDLIIVGQEVANPGPKMTSPRMAKPDMTALRMVLNK